MIRPWAAAVLSIGLLAWAGATPAGPLERLLMPGDVAKAHAKLENECSKCHDRTDKDRQTTLCIDCHKDIGADLKQKRGFHGHALKPGSACTACHTEHKGRAADIVRFDRESFDHSITGFKLDGRHSTTGCDACHVAGKKLREVQTTCFDCHQKQDIHQGKLGKDCASCHTKDDIHLGQFGRQCDRCHSSISFHRVRPQ